MTDTSAPTDLLDLNGDLVVDFQMRYRNDRNRVRRTLDQGYADMIMGNIRKLWADGSWRHYRHALGEFEWLEHEFDYFLASCMLDPGDVATKIRNGSFDDWAVLINSTNPGKGQHGQTRRPVGEIADQIRRGVPGGHGDPDVWVRYAAAGFGDRNDQQIAASPKKLAAAKKAGNITAVKRGPLCRINLWRKRDETKSENVQKAEMIAAYLADNPRVAAIVKRRL